MILVHKNTGELCRLQNCFNTTYGYEFFIVCTNNLLQFGPQNLRSLRRYYSYVLRIKSIFFTMNSVAKTTSFHCNKKSILWCDMNESMTFFNMTCLQFREHSNYGVNWLYKLRLIDK